MPPSEHEVTQLLLQWSKGDEAALARLIPLVYRELHKLAKGAISRHYQGHTLQTTDVIHEAYLKLAGDSDRDWENRCHFFAVAAKAMRQVLVDHARAKHAVKRGGLREPLPLDEDLAAVPSRAAGLLALDDALSGLSKLDARKGQAVELRYFGGLSVEETAKVLQVSPDTVLRDLRFARSWLNRELGH
jgi:RNA polymerase sigma factor (TIGR02999 family)